MDFFFEYCNGQYGFFEFYGSILIGCISFPAIIMFFNIIDMILGGIVDSIENYFRGI